MLEYAWICLNMPEYAWIYLNIPEYAWICLNIPEYDWICLNMPDILQGVLKKQEFQLLVIINDSILKKIPILITFCDKI